MIEIDGRPRVGRWTPLVADVLWVGLAFGRSWVANAATLF
jgi:hypothetical protein